MLNARRVRGLGDEHPRRRPGQCKRTAQLGRGEWLRRWPKVLGLVAALIALSACTSALPKTQPSARSPTPAVSPAEVVVPTPFRCTNAPPQSEIDAAGLPLQPHTSLILCVLRLTNSAGSYQLEDGRDLHVNECRGCEFTITGAKTQDIAGHTWHHTDIDGSYSLYTTLENGLFVALSVPRGESDDADRELLTEIAWTLR
jgi:hypothetical protein